MDPESSNAKDPGSSELVKVAALGRPFSLGMLYDCRSDQLVSGYTLWDAADLQKGTRKSPKPYTQFDIVASESVEEKTKSMNVEASLKASFLGGLVDLKGSAKYLNESKTSQNQARVTMNYKTTTEFRQLSMNTLGHVKYPVVFDKDTATHVVTGILYGAQAFFVFDREVSDGENRQTIEGSMKVVIKKFPSIAIGGEGSVKLDDEDKKAVDKFSCKFIGDFQLENNPVNFADAIETYKNLPELLGPNGENAVPMSVWLMPLKILDSKAARLVREIGVGLVNDAQSVLEDFSELELRYNDALKSTVAQQFPQISKKLNTFKDLCNEYRLGFQKTLADILPSIRGGGKEESVLAEIMKGRYSSLFNNNKLNEWMRCKEREINVIKSLTDMMKNTKVVANQNDFEKIIYSPKTQQAFCYAFTSLEIVEPYLLDLSNYLETPKAPKVDVQDVEEVDAQDVPWYSTNWKSMREKAMLFHDFSAAYEGDENMQFLITAKTNEKQKGASVYYYKEGCLESDNFLLPPKSQLPSKLETPDVIDITHNSVTLKMVPPRSEAEDISHCSIEYCVAGQKEPQWQQHTVPKADEVTTVSNLTVNEEYMFRYRAMYPLGNGPLSDVIEMKTLPTSPPVITSIKWSTHSDMESIKVAWEKPTEVGKGVTVEEYSMEVAEETTGMRPEQLIWIKRRQTKETHAQCLTGRDTYVVRVTCECGEDGRSKASPLMKSGECY